MTARQGKTRKLEGRGNRREIKLRDVRKKQGKELHRVGNRTAWGNKAEQGESKFNNPQSPKGDEKGDVFGKRVKKDS